MECGFARVSVLQGAQGTLKVHSVPSSTAANPLPAGRGEGKRLSTKSKRGATLADAQRLSQRSGHLNKTEVCRGERRLTDRTAIFIRAHRPVDAGCTEDVRGEFV